MAVEAGSPQGWHEFVDAVVGLDRFGASAPAADLYRELGVTPEAVADEVRRLITTRST